MDVTRFERREGVPPACLKEPVVMGIDEAGRGAVLGPMTYGCAFWPESINEEIETMSFDDSKALTSEKRAQMFKELRAEERIGWIVKLISAQEISQKMLRRTPVSLNVISHDAAIELVTMALNEGVKVTKVIVDTVGDPTFYQRKLTEAFDHKIDFIVEKKADANFKPVGAASIAAKVLRDEAIEHWTWTEPGLDLPIDFGSGYPSDPKTCDWMKKHFDNVFGFGSIARFSWGPVKQMLCEPPAATLEWSEDEDEEEEYAKGSMKLTSFFFQKSNGPAGKRKPTHEPRTRPYKDRKLTLVDEF